jgi:hypothetical protein
LRFQGFAQNRQETGRMTVHFGPTNPFVEVRKHHGTGHESSIEHGEQLSDFACLLDDNYISPLTTITSPHR